MYHISDWSQRTLAGIRLLAENVTLARRERLCKVFVKD